MKIAAAALLLAASLAVPATAHADCGDPGQEPCTGPVPTVDQVDAVITKLFDPARPATSKTDVVTPGFTPEEAGIIDDHLNRINTAGLLPFNIVVSNIQPAPNNLAGATVGTPGSFYKYNPPGPIVLVNQGGHWLITHDTAMPTLDRFWYNAYNRGFRGVPRAIP
ncbi:hypothetical protein [Mycobacterium sp.]|uniref:hypothetical protein n=1 Tax=Mycobacterium sp. TaxID=1785 RepID=UPI003D0E78E6